jgi:hypothetical protein
VQNPARSAEVMEYLVVARIAEHARRSVLVRTAVEADIRLGPIHKSGVSEDDLWAYVNDVVLNVLMFATSPEMGTLTNAIRRGKGSMRFRAEGASLIPVSFQRLFQGPATFRTWYQPVCLETNGRVRIPERILVRLQLALTIAQSDKLAVKKLLNPAKLDTILGAVDSGLSNLLGFAVEVAGRFSVALIHEGLTELVIRDVQSLAESAMQAYMHPGAPKLVPAIRERSNALSEFKKYATATGMAWVNARLHVRPPTEKVYDLSRRQVCPLHQS